MAWGRGAGAQPWRAGRARRPGQKEAAVSHLLQPRLLDCGHQKSTCCVPTTLAALPTHGGEACGQTTAKAGLEDRRADSQTVSQCHWPSPCLLGTYDSAGRACVLGAALPSTWLLPFFNTAPPPLDRPQHHTGGSLRQVAKPLSRFPLSTSRAGTLTFAFVTSPQATRCCPRQGAPPGEPGKKRQRTARETATTAQGDSHTARIWRSPASPPSGCRAARALKTAQCP